MKTIVLSILWFTFFCFFLNNTSAQSGTLDSSYGVNGKVTIAAGYDFRGSGEAALQTDGKLVTVGNTYIDWIHPDSLLLIRCLPNGKLDSGFGINGRAAIAFNFGVSIVLGSSVVIQPDGKIIAGGGYFKGGAMTDHFVLVRYLPNGIIDSSFGSNGIVFTNTGPTENFITKLCLQKDGKILAGGNSDGCCLIRYNTNGSIDSSFALNGIFIDPGNADPEDIIVQDDNKIITVGTKQDENRGYGFKLVQLRRFMPDGTKDSSFGVNGIVESDFSADYETGESMVLLNDGKIVVAGGAYNPDSDTSKMFLSKYKANGSLDSSFGNKGVVITNIIVSNEDNSGKLLQQFNGKFVLTGAVMDGSLSAYRFNTNGSIDLTFGRGGKADADFGTTAKPNTAVLQPDGKIIIVGIPGLSLARFKGDEPVTVSIKRNITVTEGNTGTHPVQFTIVLNKPYSADVSVNYTTKNIGARAEVDYIAASGTLKIKAGKASATISVQVTGDNTVEPNEKFALLLSRPVNAVLGAPDSATCMIKNDDYKSNLQMVLANTGIGKNVLSVSPNPVKNILTLKGLQAENIYTIYIIDMQGRIIMKNTTASPVYQQHVERLAVGNYQVFVTSGNYKQSIPFIKQ